MTIRGKRILIISPEPWGKNWVSKHHYAAHLGKLRNTVYFLSPETEVAKDEVASGVYLLAAPKIARGVRYFPSPLRRAYHRSLGRELVRSADGPFDLVWSFEASCYLDLDCLSPGAKTIFFWADRNDRLPWKTVARSADLCLSVCHALVKELRKVSANAHFIHHGHTPQESPDYRFETPGPNIVYAGNLAHHSLDKTRIERLVLTYPEAIFHFFGDTGKDNLGLGEEVDFAKILRNYANVFVHGSVPSRLLPEIYRAADALILAHKPGFDQIGNPHKMMEYLASGTPILSTRLAEYSELSDAILMTDDLAEHMLALEIALREDNEERRLERRAFAAAHTYEKQLARILHLLCQSGAVTPTTDWCLP